MKRDAFQKLIRRVLTEEIEKTNSVGGKSFIRVPEMNGNGVNPDPDRHKTFASDANSTDAGSKNQMLEELIKLAAEINKDVLVQWDDHDDIMVNARDLKYIRISPRWTDYYVIEMMTRNDDRIWMTGLGWEQVKEFVKINLKELNKQPTSVEKAYDKSYRNRQDKFPPPDKSLPQKDKPKTLPLTSEPPKTTKNKEKNYTEQQVKKKEDMPDQPMRAVGDFKWTSDYKVKDPVKLRKRKPDTKLTVKQT